jgi:cardiolipin synthase
MSTRDEKLFFSNLTFFFNLGRKIKGANHSIKISVYIFDDDRVGQFILNLLRKACLRGVKVSVVVDGYGSIDSYLSLRKKLEHPLAEIRIYNPLPWPFAHFYLVDYLKNSRFVPFFSHINRRNHTKLVSIDSRCLFLGSRNLTQKILSWRETSVLIHDQEVVEQVDSFFHWLWIKSFFFQKPLFQKPKKFDHSDKSVYFSYPRNARRAMLRTLIRKISGAEGNIQITMPYFFPPVKLISALYKASLRGVLIEIILPAYTDVFLFPRMSRFLYSTLMKFGIHLFEYQESMIHAKQFRVDDWIMIGSSNLNSRSLFHDLEVDYVLNQSVSVKKVIDQFEKDKWHSKEIFHSDLSDSLLNRFFNYLISKIFGGSI